MLLIPLLMLGQAAPAATATFDAAAYADREMASYLAKAPVVDQGCMRKFMRLKVARLALDVLVDLDAIGNVTATRIGGSGSGNDALDQCAQDWVRRMQFRDDAPRHGTYVMTLGNARLMPPPPKFEPYAGDDAAIIGRWGAAVSLCKLSGLAGPSGRKACSAYVSMVDLHVAKWYAGSIRIAPGARRLDLACSTQSFGGVFPLELLQSQAHVFALQPGGHYQLDAHWEADTCVVDIVDTDSGQRLEKRPVGTAAAGA